MKKYYKPVITGIIQGQGAAPLAALATGFASGVGMALAASSRDIYTPGIVSINYKGGKK